MILLQHPHNFFDWHEPQSLPTASIGMLWELVEGPWRLLGPTLAAPDTGDGQHLWLGIAILRTYPKGWEADSGSTSCRPNCTSQHHWRAVSIGFVEGGTSGGIRKFRWDKWLPTAFGCCLDLGWQKLVAQAAKRGDTTALWSCLELELTNGWDTSVRDRPWEGGCCKAATDHWRISKVEICHEILCNNHIGAIYQRLCGHHVTDTTLVGW